MHGDGHKDISACPKRWRLLSYSALSMAVIAAFGIASVLQLKTLWYPAYYLVLPAIFGLFAPLFLLGRLRPLDRAYLVVAAALAVPLTYVPYRVDTALAQVQRGICEPYTPDTCDMPASDSRIQATWLACLAVAVAVPLLLATVRWPKPSRPTTAGLANSGGGRTPAPATTGPASAVRPGSDG